MCKLLKLLLILFFATAGAAFSAEKAGIVDSFGKCSIKGDCSDIVNDVRDIHNAPAEINIMKFENLLPQSIIPVSDTYAEIPKNPYDGLFSQAVRTYPHDTIYKKSSLYISVVNPKSSDTNVNANYPGLRGANQLVIYTPEFGLKTGTNEFGAEAVVVGNTVKKLSGSDSIIPKNGFVISGHGSAKKWIQQNIVLGSKIYIDTKDLRIYSFVTPDTYVFETEEKIKQVQNVIKYYQMMDNCYDSRRAAGYLSKAKDFVRKAERNKSKTVHFLSQAKVYLDLALKNAIPYSPNELKGVWIRPVEHSEEEIIQTVQRLKDTGINNVFLETYYHGTTIYPSEVLKKYGITSQRGEFNQFDPLKIWIDECHKNKIKVHIWFESFYVGNKPPRSSRSHVLAVHPEWANNTKANVGSGEIAYSTAEHNGYFIDPANPEVQQYVVDILNEIIEKYHPDGINLDYIRYPLCAKIKSDKYRGTEWGYSDYARKEFKELYGVDPIDLKVSDDLWSEWYRYREDKITDFVKTVRKMTRKKNIVLTAVIFPNREEVRQTKMQDWKRWSVENLVDGFTPLLLTTDRNTAGNLIHDMKIQMSPYSKLFPGIFVMFMDSSEDELLMQIHETRKMHSNGVILFDYAHLKDKYSDALKVRVFKQGD